MVDTNSIIEGTVKFRDGKKWKSRWCVMRKLSPVADCLHLQLYRDSKDRYKQGQTKASLSLQHFLGIESGFTLDKESNTIAIICQDVIVVLAFDTRERLIQWQVKISTNLGEDLQYLILISTAPSKAKLPSGPARMHVQDYKFCLTTGVPPRLAGVWEIGHLRRYGVVEGRFCFEGGSRCGKGEGLYVLVTDLGGEITQTLQLAVQGKLSTKRRPVSRKMSAMDSPRKQLHPRSETRNSDISCLDAFNTNQQLSNVINNPNADMSRSLYSHDDSCQCHTSLHACMQHNDDLICPCHRTSSPFNWSTESHSGVHQHSNADLDSNYGCGDTVSVSEMHDIVHSETWIASDNHGRNELGQPSLERCMSCISKLGAPSMSRSSTATVSGTPCTNGPLFNPAWTMENSQVPTCTHRAPPIGNTSDRMSVCSSHGSSSGNSEYSVPRQCLHGNDTTRNISSPTPPSVPPKSPKNIQHPLTLATTVQPCQCPPSRPPKPPQLSNSANNSPIKKKIRKLPMPLPITTPLKPANPTCSCQFGNIQESINQHVGPYENYDIPKTPLLVEPKNNESVVIHQPSSSTNPEENYDTPKKIMECLASDQQGMNNTLPSVQTMSIRKPCGCILKFNKKTMPLTESKLLEHPDEAHSDCPCRRVTPMCWPGNWMTIPYCRRGNGMENTSLPITNQIVPENKSETMAIYATVDKSKKTNRKPQELCMCPENGGNYANIEPLLPPKENKENISNTTPTTPAASFENYENIDFAQSLEHYENAKQLLQKAGITQEELDRLEIEMKPDNQQHATNISGPKLCHKCGHASTKVLENESLQSELEISQGASMDKQDDYLMMEPGKSNQPPPESVQKPQPEQHPFPGYIPMSPITNTNNDKVENSDLLKHCVNRLLGEKSSSNPSLVGPPVDRSRKRSDSDMRISGAAMLMHHHVGNSPYNRKQIMDSSDCIESCRKSSLIARKRSSSADSSRYVEEDPDDLDNSLTTSRTTSPSTETLRKSSLSSLTNNDSTQIEHRLSSPCLHQETEPCYSEEYCRKLSIDVNSNETEGEDNSSLTSDSLRTQVTSHPQTVNIRRSSSVPCKSGQNRDSSSSNDSGVSTGSLKHRGADFAEFELPLTTSMSSRRHHHYAQRLMIAPTNCLHSSLPRRSKSSDPLRELTFQFQKIKIPAKSSSAEAEVPIFSTKGLKGFSSPADSSSMGPPYIDSRSTSSGTSDMSDYIETLSLSSHSSSDAADLRLIRQPTTTLRPRSGKEYHSLDRSILVGQHGLILDGTMKLQACGTTRGHGISRDPNASYANITPVPEKSESPSPGYMSGSSPGQETAPTVPQTLLPGASHFSFQKTQ